MIVKKKMMKKKQNKKHEKNDNVTKQHNHNKCSIVSNDAIPYI